MTPGAAFGVLAWILASAAFFVYVSTFASYSATYGAFATVVILLVWLYLTNLVLVFGAELNAAVDRRRASPLSRPRAHRRPARAVAAQLAVRRVRDREAAVEQIRGEAGESFGERTRVRERGGHRLVGALEEAVGDLGARRAVAQGGERVDEPLGRVVALDDVGGSRALEPVGLVVDDQRAAVRLARDDVDEAGHERPAARRVERERERGLLARPARAREAGAQRRARKRGHELADVLELGRGRLEAPLGGQLGDGFHGGRGRPRVVEILEQPMHERPAHPRVEAVPTPYLVGAHLHDRGAISSGGGATRGRPSTRSR